VPGLRERMRRIEGRPATQYHFHKIMARFWALVTLPLLVLVLFAPAIWLKYGVAYVMVASNYANWATDGSVMTGANASTADDITTYAIGQSADSEDSP
jgi:hypothetical protein